MPGETQSPIDDIGPWSEVKLSIIREYATAYSRILAAQRLQHVYIDAFAGAGMNVSRTTGQFVPGSPLNALSVEPPFKEYHLVDLDSEKVGALKELVGDRGDVHIYEGDGNRVLLERVLPGIRFEDYRRGLCLLDPYGLDLDWRVIKKAGEMETVEVFLNFPIMHMNRNILRHNPDTVSPEERDRMTAYWGDNSWEKIAYSSEGLLFGDMKLKEPNEVIVEAFRKRLTEVAGFRYVPEPMPMKNRTGAVVYYLFFATQKPVAKKIVLDIFAKYGR